MTQLRAAGLYSRSQTFTVSAFRHRPARMISSVVAPFLLACVTCPARRLWKP